MSTFNDDDVLVAPLVEEREPVLLGPELAAEAPVAQVGCICGVLVGPLVSVVG